MEKEIYMNHAGEYARVTPEVKNCYVAYITDDDLRALPATLPILPIVLIYPTDTNINTFLKLKGTAVEGNLLAIKMKIDGNTAEISGLYITKVISDKIKHLLPENAELQVIPRITLVTDDREVLTMEFTEDNLTTPEIIGKSDYYKICVAARKMFESYGYSPNTIGNAQLRSIERREAARSPISRFFRNLFGL